MIFALALSGVAQQEPEALEGKEQKKLAPVKENDQPADKEGDNPDKSAKGKGEIQALTPARTAGAVDIVVTNADGQSGRLAAAFTYFADDKSTGDT